MKIAVRLATPADAEKFLEYEQNTPNNLWDNDAGLYPSSFTLCTESVQGPLVFMPIQRPFVLESLGISPTATKREIAVSLRKLIDQLMAYAKQAGVGELMFTCQDESTAAFAERHGFEKFEFPIYRLKTKNYN